MLAQGTRAMHKACELEIEHLVKHTQDLLKGAIPEPEAAKAEDVHKLHHQGPRPTARPILGHGCVVHGGCGFV